MLIWVKWLSLAIVSVPTNKYLGYKAHIHTPAHITHALDFFRIPSLKLKTYWLLKVRGEKGCFLEVRVHYKNWDYPGVRYCMLRPRTCMHHSASCTMLYSNFASEMFRSASDKTQDASANACHRDLISQSWGRVSSAASVHVHCQVTFGQCALCKQAPGWVITLSLPT